MREYFRWVPYNINERRKCMLSKTQVKYIQSLGHKKFRDEAGVFIAEGPKIVKEIVNDVPGSLQSVYGVEEWINDHPALTVKNLFTPVTEAELSRISQLATPNTVLAVVKKFDEPVIETKN